MQSALAVGECHPVQIPDIQLDPTYKVHYLIELDGIRAVLALPMLRGDQAIGGIALWHRQPRHFSVEEEVYLQALAQQSVNAAVNAQLFETEREQRKLAEALRETGIALAASLDLEQVIDNLLDKISSILPFDAGSIIVMEGSQVRLTRLRGSPWLNPCSSEHQLVLDAQTHPCILQMQETKQPCDPGRFMP